MVGNQNDRPCAVVRHSELLMYYSLDNSVVGAALVSCRLPVRPRKKYCLFPVTVPVKGR